jgi:transposase
MARRRFELTDEQFERIEAVLPSESEGRGRPMKDHRPIINGIFWILRTGAPWRDLPARYGPWKTVYDRFRQWSEDGTLAAMVERLQAELDLKGEIDWSQFDIDSTSVRASRAAAGGPDDDKKGNAPNMKMRETARGSATGAGAFPPKYTW